MRVLYDARFEREIEAFSLKFTCEDCIHLNRERDRCAHEYPSEMHRRAAFAHGASPTGMFCKEFELV